MSYLAKGRRCDLEEIIAELGLEVPARSTVPNLKEIIVKSENYDEEFIKVQLDRIINDRREEREIEKEAMQRQFELEKLRIETESKRSINQNVNNDKHIQTELRSLMHQYDPNEGDISLYLILFERQAKRVNLEEENWVSHLLGLLPYEINQLIARESEEKASDYKHVKQLLLKRFKLNPEQFRQKFTSHAKTPRNTWKDFVFELRNYFEEWVNGLELYDFEGLKSLIIADQLKKSVPSHIREHFIDEWTNLNDPENLSEKLDDYENVRSGMKISKPEFVKNKFVPKFNHQNINHDNSNYKFQTENKRNNSFRYDKGEIKCFNCGQYGRHLAKDCPKPKVTIICKKCELPGHTQKHCQASKQQSSLTVSHPQNSSNAVVKKVKINNSAFVETLIDTGSSLSLIRHSIAKKLGLPIQADVRELYGIGNSEFAAAVTLGKVHAKLEIDGVKTETDLFIVNDSAQPYELIVGRDILNDNKIAYGKIGDTLRVWYANDIPFQQLQNEVAPKQVKLFTDNVVEIRANTVNFLSVKSNDVESGLILFENKSEGPDSVLELVDGKTVIPIINVGTKNIRLEKNQCVGRADELNDWELSEIEVVETVKDKFNKPSNDVCIVSQNKRDIKLDEIIFDESTSDNEKNSILKLLNEYRDCIALNLNDLGCTNLVKMDIKEVDGSKPVCLRPYKTNAEERETIKRIVSEWKKNGIVSETRSPYASPVLLVKKKTGEQRLVVDYRRLNNQTIKDKFPLPRIDDLLETLGKCKLFTTLDLAHGYLQIPLSEDAKSKTAFITPDDTGQFERMIFGLANAPAEFQRLMHCVLGPLLNTKALCYLDDILIPAKSWKEMLERLREVLERLRTARLTLKLSKCEFGRKEVNFLGFIINESGIKPGARKIAAIKEFPEPTNVHETRRFLGLTGYFRRFIPNYAQKAEPLTRLTKKDEEFRWEEDQMKAFKILKDQLTDEPILAHYQPDVETEVHCDASAEGLGGMLMQRSEDKKWHLVYCVSKKTSDVEKKYHSSRLELMAIVWTLDRLRQFLIGIKFKIITDCQALVYMNAKKTTNPQIARWCSLIQEYDFEVVHRSGKKLSHVDAMSRAPVSEADDTVTSIVERFEVYQTLTEEEQILMIQHSDRELRKIIDVFKKDKNDRTAEEKQLTKDYVLKKSRLFRRTLNGGREKLLYVIPKSMRKGIVIKFHDLFGHFSVERTMSKIKESYWFKGMKRYVRRHISMCFQCLMNKIPSGKKQGELHPIKPGRRPFAIIHVDHLGPFVKSSRSNRELFVIIDNFTRFTRLYPMRSTATKSVMIALRSFVEDFGLPERIISDRGTCFTANEFQEYCRINGIKHTLNSTQHPQGNGMVERANRTILSVIKTGTENLNHRDWDKRIRECERNLNNMINKTTGKTPFELLHGYLPKFNDGILRLMTDEDSREWKDPALLQAETRKIIDDKQRTIKSNFDKKISKSLTFDVGEVVVMRRALKSTGDSTKLQPKYRGPLIVTEVLPSDTYRVTQLEEKTKGHFYNTTAHMSQLKSWYCQAESDEDDDDNDDDQPE